MKNLNVSITGSAEDHGDRRTLHEEVHSRPPVPLWPNERVISQAFLLDGSARAQQLQWISKVSERYPIISDPIHRKAISLLSLRETPQRLLLKWELHGEFVSITIYAQQASENNFASRKEVMDEVNRLLLSKGASGIHSSGGERIVALDIALESGSFYADAQDVAARFHGNTMIGSVILTSQKAQLWTDLQFDDESFVNVLLRHTGLGSRQAGRTVQRIIDIETYRMMALLALPSAKSLSEPLRQSELHLSKLSEQIAAAQEHGTLDVTLDADLLKGVSAIASRVEGWISANGLRFTAAEAYHDILKRSLNELRESVIPGVQSMHEFMDRRFEPAMRTCMWTTRRLRDLSDRVSRTTQILRTRIEYVNESQTQALLSSMDRRAKLQLRLQQTVEGLSIIVMTYYATGLLMYIAKGLGNFGVSVNPDLVGLIAVPVIGISLYAFLTARRKKQANL